MGRPNGLAEKVAFLLYLMHEEYLNDRPRKRGDCKDGYRPCPYIGCRYHLYMDYTSRGIPKSLWWDRDPMRMKETCSLDIADEGERTLEEIGKIWSLTRERVRQIETEGLGKMKDEFNRLGYSDQDVQEALRELSESYDADMYITTSQDDNQDCDETAVLVLVGVIESRDLSEI